MSWQIPALTGAFGLFTTGLTAYFAMKQRRPEQRTADWSSFTREMREWTEDQLQERDHRIEEIRKELDDVKLSFAELRIKYRAAIEHVRYLLGVLRRHHAPLEINPPPPEIAEDVH